MAFPLETQRWRLLKRSSILVSGWTILCLCPNMSPNLHPPATFSYPTLGVSGNIYPKASAKLSSTPWLYLHWTTATAFYGHPAKLLSQLQRVQNSAARLIHQSTRYSPSSPLLQDLHWLPIKYRCIFKILLITFKAIHGHAPSYIQDLVKVKHQTRTLRSSTATYLDDPSIKSSNNLGERYFYIAASTEWKPLPANIRNSPLLDVFIKRLKIHLSTKAFDT